MLTKTQEINNEEAIDNLNDKDHETLLHICGLLAGCFGADARTSAVIITTRGSHVGVAGLNATTEEIAAILEGASNVFKEYHALPPKGMLN